MKRLTVKYHITALHDLEDIYRSVYKVSINATLAENFVRRIQDRCKRIGDVPLGGRSRDDLKAGLRTMPFEKKAVIAYLVEESCVRIVGVFYGGRDYEALYRGHEISDKDSAT